VSDAATDSLTSLRDHERAGPAIRRAKALGGLAGFAISTVAGLGHGAPLAGTLEHALEGGVAAYVLTWAAAVTIWRRVLTAQALAAARRAKTRAGTAE
jgi:hypothetical protein